jgi:DUF4097 and DUF4098 domain-containing protein YvlB
LTLCLVVLVCLQAACKQFAAVTAEGTFQRTLEVTGPTRIDLSTGSGSVNVRPGNSSQILVTGRVTVTNWFGGDAQHRVKALVDDPPIQQSAGDIRISHISDPGLLHNVSISYDLVVPQETRLRSHTGSGDQAVEGLRGELEIEAGAGNLKISDIADAIRAETGSGNIHIDRATGSVRADIGSGSIDASDIAGVFEGRTGSGDIRLNQSSPASVRVATGSGAIELRGVRGPLEATAGSGSIAAEGNPTGGWNLTTGSGNVRLKLASAAAFDLDAHTNSGAISISQPVTPQDAPGARELRGKVHGGGVSVKVETDSGDIEIQ